MLKFADYSALFILGAARVVSNPSDVLQSVRNKFGEVMAQLGEGTVYLLVQARQLGTLFGLNSGLTSTLTTPYVAT
jgi:hypothetical protein